MLYHLQTLFNWIEKICSFAQNHMFIFTRFVVAIELLSIASHMLKIESILSGSDELLGRNT